MQTLTQWFRKMRWLIQAASLVSMLLLLGCAQRSVQLMHEANEIPSQDKASWVRAIWEKPRLHQVVIVDKAGHKQVVAASSVWGYRTNHNQLYRQYRDMFYEVLQRGPLSVYQIDEWAGESHWLSYYFSITPNGDIYDLDRRTAKAVFKDDACMEGLLTQMRDRHLLQQDSHGSYGLANAYSFCHCRDRVQP